MRQRATAAPEPPERTAEFFAREATLPAGLRPASGPRGTGVLLTGATGLVGTYLLRELLARTDRPIACIVRADDDAAARERLIEHLGRAGVAPEIVDRRIHALAGNVATPNFGLTPQLFAELAERVGLLFHNAARINFLLPYRGLRAVNVGSAHEALRFAATGGAKEIAYTSTMAVLESPARGYGVAIETDPALYPEALPAGYPQTKWVAEATLRNARDRGFAASIFRAPWIVETGSVEAPDFVMRFFEACRGIGALPDSIYRWNLVTADWVARALVALVLDGGMSQPVHHLGSAETPTTRELAPRLTRFLGDLPLVPVEQWRDQLGAAFASGGASSLRPLASAFLRPTPGYGSSIPADTYLYGRVPLMDSRRTLMALAQLGIAAPVVDDALVNALFR